ncbi:MAG: hypothetical protein KDD14_25405, partial [Saprospiraceae bacterium]|nr:hypothetical protein [Saprospiraceae bacterium]
TEVSLFRKINLRVLHSLVVNKKSRTGKESQVRHWSNKGQWGRQVFQGGLTGQSVGRISDDCFQMGWSWYMGLMELGWFSGFRFQMDNGAIWFQGGKFWAGRGITIGLWGSGFRDCGWFWFFTGCMAFIGF